MLFYAALGAAGTPRPGPLFLLVVEALHKEAVDLLQLLVGVQGGEQLLAVFLNGLEDDHAVLVAVLRVLLQHGGEKAM